MTINTGVKRDLDELAPNGERIVYFLRMQHPAGESPIKIGYCKHVGMRVSMLLTASPYDLDFMGYLDTDTPKALERALHNHFSGRRLRREWFSLTKPELLTGLKELDLLHRFVDADLMQWRKPVKAEPVDEEMLSVLTLKRVRQMQSVVSLTKLNQAAERGGLVTHGRRRELEPDERRVIAGALARAGLRLTE